MRFELRAGFERRGVHNVMVNNSFHPHVRFAQSGQTRQATTERLILPGIGGAAKGTLGGQISAEEKGV